MKLSTKKKGSVYTNMTLPTSRSLPAGVPIATHALVDFPVLNEFVSVYHTRLLNAFQTANDPENLYIRQDVVDAFKEWNTGGRLHRVIGPPGSGKSISLFLYIIDRVSRAQKGTMAYWFSVGVSRHVSIVNTGNNTCSIVSLMLPFSSWVTEIELVDGNPLIVVFDAIETGDLTHLSMIIDSCLSTYPNCRVYTCGSMATTLDRRLIHDPNYGSSKFEFKPWMYTDFQAMIADAQFFRSVKANLLDVSLHADAFDLDVAVPVELTRWQNRMWSATALHDGMWTAAEKEYALKTKFQLAGHNIRWMFGFDYVTAHKEIVEFVSMVQDIGEIIEGTTFDMRKTFKNHLRCSLIMNDVYRHVFISEFVGRALIRKVDSSFIRLAYHVCTSVAYVYPAFDDLVLVLDVIHCLKNNTLNSRVMFRQEDAHGNYALGPVETTRYSSRFVQMPSVSDWSGSEPLFALGAVAFYPTIFTNGGFDFVIVRWAPNQLQNQQQQHNVLTAEFVQVARSSPHTLKLRFLRNFVNKFNQDPARANPEDKIQQVEVTFMCPATTAMTFDKTSIAAAGTLAFGYNFESIRVAGFTRTV